MRPALLLWCGSMLLFGQVSPEAQQKCLVEGKVVNSVTGEPVRKARVMLLSGSAWVMTDAASHFSFGDVKPGSHSTDATHNGFEPPLEQQRTHTPPQFTLAPGEEKRDLVIRLSPLAAIMGHVVDEYGDPIRSIQIRAMTYQYSAAGRQLVDRADAATNDLGEYRIFDVRPGRYLLQASAQEIIAIVQPWDAYATAYYPGTADTANAAMVEVRAGQTPRRPGFHAASDPPRQYSPPVVNPGSDLRVALRSATWRDMRVNDKGGKFELRGILPGSYSLTAEGTVDGEQYSTQILIQVGTTDLEGTELHLQPPIQVAGLVRIEGKSALHPTTTVCTVSAAGPPDEVYLESVHWSDREVTYTAIDLTQGAGGSRLMIVMSANGGQIDGIGTGDQGAPAPATITLVPSGAGAKTHFKSTDAGSDGHFQFKAVAPGSYRLFAFDAVDPNQVRYDQDFLKPYDSRAGSVEIEESSRKSVQLKLIKVEANQ